jgi:putative endonuclease
MDVHQAIAFEKQVKGWRREKKEAIIDGDWNQLFELSKCKNKTSHMIYALKKKSNSNNDD